MRTLTKDSNIYEIRDRIVKVYLKKILRRFRQLNQSLLSFDEINSMTAVYTAYDEVVEMSVEALKEIAKQTYRWICDEDFLVDMWLSDWLKQADPVMHYKFYDEADRKRSRLFEAVESVRTSAERKKQIDIGMRYWVKQFEQTADNLVDDVVLQAYRDNGVKYVMWMIMNDAKVCNDCYRRKGKIYPIDSPLLRALHWNCRCWWIPIRKNVSKK
jgi:SPP1 gp7 family putative phage head morphogenesis protein